LSIAGAILLAGGWDDSTAPIETVLLTFYRALKPQPHSAVTLITYPDRHSFRVSHGEMASDIRDWHRAAVCPVPDI